MRTTVLITRPEHQAEPLRSDLEALGAEVLHQPMIEIRPPESWDAVDDAIRHLPDFDYLVFSSSNGVDFFFDRLQARRADFDLRCRFAVAGTGTDAALRRRIGRPADVLPTLFSAEGMLEQLLPEAKGGKRFLLLRASRGRDLMKRALEQAGGDVTEVVVYQSVDVQAPRPEILDRMRSGSIDWVTVTSSSIARSLVRLFGNALDRTRLVGISPITTSVLTELGHPPCLEATTASLPGIVEVLKPRLDETTIVREGAIAVIRRGDRFLVITRSATVIAPGKLCFPGGGIEPDETPRQALIRECREELGIEVEPVREIDVSITPWNVRLRWWFATIRNGDEPLRPNPEEVADVQWLTLEEIIHHPDLLDSNLPFLERLKNIVQ